MIFLLLLLVYVCPTPWGSNGNWLKVALMGMLVTWLSWRTVETRTSDAWHKVFWLVVAGLDLILMGGVCSGQYWPFIVFGSQERVSGWLPMLVAFGVCELFWQQWTPADSCGCWSLPMRQRKMHERLGWVFVGVIGVASWLIKVKGWDTETQWIASVLGTGELMAVIIPVLVMTAVNEFMVKREWWVIGAVRGMVVGCAVVLAVMILVKSGCRSALLGVVAGLSVILVLQVRRVWIWVGGVGTILGLWFSAVMNDYMLERLLAVNPFEMGRGPRTQLMAQFLDHGTPLLGWGPEQGRWIINQDIVGGQENGIYDTFHCFPVDMVSAGGWLMLPIMVGIGWILAQAIWRHRINIRMAGYAGGLVASMVCGIFNPPSLIQLMTVGLCVGGVLAVDTGLEPETSLWGLPIL